MSDKPKAPRSELLELIAANQNRQDAVRAEITANERQRFITRRLIRQYDIPNESIVVFMGDAYIMKLYRLDHDVKDTQHISIHRINDVTLPPAGEEAP